MAESVLECGFSCLLEASSVIPCLNFFSLSFLASIAFSFFFGATRISYTSRHYRIIQPSFGINMFILGCFQQIHSLCYAASGDEDCISQNEISCESLGDGL